MSSKNLTNQKFFTNSFCESNPSNRKKVIILGSGPNRIGQGIEFDYTCVHSAFAFKVLAILSDPTKKRSKLLASILYTFQKSILLFSLLSKIVKCTNPLGICTFLFIPHIYQIVNY